MLVAPAPDSGTESLTLSPDLDTPEITSVVLDLSSGSTNQSARASLPLGAHDHDLFATPMAPPVRIPSRAIGDSRQYQSISQRVNLSPEIMEGFPVSSRDGSCVRKVAHKHKSPNSGKRRTLTRLASKSVNAVRGLFRLTK